LAHNGIDNVRFFVFRQKLETLGVQIASRFQSHCQSNYKMLHQAAQKATR